MKTGGYIVDTQQPMSDDQELAKALSGVSDAPEQSAEEEPKAEIVTTMAPAAPVADDAAMTDDQAVAQPNLVPDMSLQQPQAAAMPAEENTVDPAADMTDLPTLAPPVVDVPASDNLDGIKKDAILELRPLVDKLSLEPSEKFDTYLLLLRSTDDKGLVAPAHEAAKAIPDEAKKAEALLEIIKEIDFLSQGNK